MGTVVSPKPKKYIIGIDVGQSGIGKSAIEVDEAGMPITILSSVVTIIDGAKDPSTGKSPRSRKAVSGVARRARRLTQNKAKRIKKLKAQLKSLGFSLETASLSPMTTYEPWLARKRLASEFVADDTERTRLLALAILHIARHRGWRNPWWKYARLLEEPTPTKEMVEIQRRASTLFDVPLENVDTLGKIGALATSPTIALRPRTATNSLAMTSTSGAVINTRVMQPDLLFELKQILTMQQVPKDQANRIARTVFETTPPSVKEQAVGKDPLDSSERRAPRTSLEFQEFRIRQTIANLVDRHTRKPIGISERNRIIQCLIEWDNEERPSWAEVASWVNREGGDLTFPISDDPHLSTAPVNRTSLELRKRRKDLKKTFAWWSEEATTAEQSQFATWLGDSTNSAPKDLIEEFIDELPEDELSVLENKCDFESGRAAYSVKTLKRLNSTMAEKGFTLSEAIDQEFHVGPNWKPSASGLFEHFEQPVVDRIMTDVGRWLQATVAKYGSPQKVVIEHVRDAFLGPAAVADYNREINANRMRRERHRAEISRATSTKRILNSDLRKYDQIQMQNSQCLYCGTPIGFNSGSEMDHIVPRAVGGSSRRENLVAVCTRCNRAKARLPFALWAAGTDFASVDDARARLKTWQRPNGMTIAAFNKLKRNVTLRLARKSHDEPLDERAMASTAFAAREVADRIKSYLENLALDSAEPTTGEVHPVHIEVYRGAITSEARKAGQIDGLVALRGAKRKTRLDRRHHAIDAAVVALIDPSIAKTLAERIEMRELAHYSDGHKDDTALDSWKAFQGSTPRAKSRYQEWKQRSYVLAALISRAVAEDQIVVHRPLRLSGNVGKLHADTVKHLINKNTSEAFRASEITRIVDNDVYLHALRISKKTGDIARIGEREDTGTVLDRPDSQIQLYPGGSVPTPRLLVRGGSASLGDSQHHARIYAVRRNDGTYEFKQLRVFAGEFALIGFKEPGIDLFTHPLPEWSQAMRCANAVLRRDISNGRARQIGWLVRGDEIEFPDGSDCIPGTPAVFDAMQGASPERRWVVKGFEQNTVLNLEPAYLAAEGIPEGASDQVVEFFKRPWRASPNVVMQANPTIIRRTSSGLPRWKAANGLPKSWNVLNATAKVFSDEQVASS